MTEFEFGNTMESVKEASTSLPTWLTAILACIAFDVKNNVAILVVPFVLIVLDAVFAVVRVKLLGQGGFESSKFKKSTGKLIIYYVAILSGWTIDILLKDAGIQIICDHTISWAVCAFLSAGEFVSVLASVVVLCPENVLAKLMLRLFLSEVSKKLEKWGIEGTSLNDEVNELLKKKEDKFKATTKRKIKG